MSLSRKGLVCAFGVILLAGAGIAINRLAYELNPLNKPFFTIDAEVPGTEVYFRDKLLGVVPLQLSKKDCLGLGLIESSNAILDDDGWGEGIPFSDLASNTYRRVMLKVPPRVESGYFVYETRWGLRTKNGQCYLETNSIRSTMMSKSKWPKGFSLQIDLPATATITDQFLNVTASLTNSSTNVIAGLRPQLEMHWGTFDVQWQGRKCKKFPLPGEWGTIKPGQSLDYSTQIPVPKTPGDYSVFATFFQFKDETTDYGAFSSYTDSKLLRVR